VENPGSDALMEIANIYCGFLVLFPAAH
jgi:hypothetical protein